MKLTDLVRHYLKDPLLDAADMEKRQSDTRAWGVGNAGPAAKPQPNGNEHSAPPNTAGDKAAAAPEQDLGDVDEETIIP